MQQSLWTDIKALLEEFVKYLEDENLDDLAANCSNTGYKRPHTDRGTAVANAGDRIMCTLMSRALFFMNENSWNKRSEDMQESRDAEMKEYVRCAIVNIFMYILLASPCRSEMGVYYAWYTMQHLESGETGLIKTGKCRQGVFADIHIQDFHMQKMIKAWLQNNGTIQDTIAGHAMTSTCNKRPQDLVSGTQDAHAMHATIPLQKPEKDVIQQLGHQIKVLVPKVQQEVMQCEHDPDACMEPSAHAGSSDVQDDARQATVSNPVESGKPARPGKEGGTESSTPATPQQPTGKDRWGESTNADKYDRIRPNTHAALI
ncbi:hypothetical protein AK88_05600 [Plasmodium fragile]|uniref:Schizont-infected cell agglutination extracellular alpha domain-containing protein n=1 Tax=Plasmodium fragile TaxID=5857 RepID=A0A0D9QCN3_PLAFR|nr:uncharacterized protein AK88_05600 [Plasmodium fragile]KJP84768.1 hypothetical protein AK88_05600 [Plasmodium fragile]